MTTSRRPPLFLGIHARPPRRLAVALMLVPFLLAVLVYGWFSVQRRAENPQDKILPAPAQMLESVRDLAFTPDKRSGGYVFWEDTVASLRRLGIGLGLGAVTGFLLGLNLGLFPGWGALGMGFLTFVAIVPPLAILPILFIAFGVDELGKIMLIFLGTFPVITRDIYLTACKVPAEQVTKALTLGAGPLALTYRIVLPQLLPRLIENVRLALGAAWLFLIAAEAIASTEGLGYRIFLVRRYLAMDVIIPYVLWITALGFSFDWLLRQWLRRGFRWYEAGK